jgi:hypothetical protein
MHILNLPVYCLDAPLDVRGRNMVTGGYGDLERDRTIWSRVVAYTKILDSFTVLECKAPKYGRLENVTRLKLPVPPGYLSQRLIAMTENEIQREGRSDCIGETYPDCNASVCTVYEFME